MTRQGYLERSGGGHYRGGIGTGPDHTQRPHDYRRFSVQSFGEQFFMGGMIPGILIGLTFMGSPPSWPAGKKFPSCRRPPSKNGSTA
jgi:hypothetical protein